MKLRHRMHPVPSVLGKPLRRVRVLSGPCASPGSTHVVCSPLLRSTVTVSSPPAAQRRSTAACVLPTADFVASRDAERQPRLSPLTRRAFSTSPASPASPAPSTGASPARGATSFVSWRSLAVFSLGTLCGATGVWLLARIHGADSGVCAFLPSFSCAPGDGDAEPAEHIENELARLPETRAPGPRRQLAAPLVAVAPERPRNPQAAEETQGASAGWRNLSTHYPAALLPSTERLLESPAFVSLVSTTRRQPLYVAERLRGPGDPAPGRAGDRSASQTQGEEGDATQREEGAEEAEGVSSWPLSFGRKRSEAEAKGRRREPQGRDTATDAPRRTPGAEAAETQPVARTQERDSEERSDTVAGSGASSEDDAESSDAEQAQDGEGPTDAALGRRGLYSKKKQKGFKATGGVDRRGLNFTQDTRIEKAWSADNSDYLRSGYSKGHLAAVALHKDSLESVQSTFSLGANIVPQNQAVNAGEWFRLEMLTKALTQLYEDVYVVSGPLWIPSDLVARTTHVALPACPLRSSSAAHHAAPHAALARSVSAPASNAAAAAAASGADAKDAQREFERPSVAQADGGSPSPRRSGAAEAGADASKPCLRGRSAQALEADDTAGNGQCDEPSELAARRGFAARLLRGKPQEKRDGEHEGARSLMRNFACLRPFSSSPDVFPVSLEALTGSSVRDRASTSAFSLFSYFAPAPGTAPRADADVLELALRACREALREQADSQPSSSSFSSSSSSPAASHPSSGKAALLHMEHEVVGSRLVAVPTHLFKVVLGVRPRRAGHGRLAAKDADAETNSVPPAWAPPPVVLGAFVVPNKKIEARGSDLSSFRVPLQFVEWISGLDFQGLVAHARENALSLQDEAPAKSQSQPPLRQSDVKGRPAAPRVSESPQGSNEAVADGHKAPSWTAPRSLPLAPTAEQPREVPLELDTDPSATERARRRRHARERAARDNFLRSIDLCRPRALSAPGESGDAGPRGGGRWKEAPEAEDVKQGRKTKSRGERTPPPTTYSFCAPGAIDKLRSS
ncbi:hypothetical protein BESB_023020 [Besnoitia besnoiti]|uniref:DNA/RNA non-specific endonuclease domain-containing protein n=1 Tax=Besnoitia besnoiti TaxID=94643 RepID=A0A2A9M8U2_BESBE|nr:hypothetical protein BESB_023020 [Besnoitia besnoiti]PFH31810.1 hypothetical protein BESB_023020 [Besnoitia besnoiti]